MKDFISFQREFVGGCQFGLHLELEWAQGIRGEMVLQTATHIAQTPPICIALINIYSSVRVLCDLIQCRLI
jgi:hypothetical protein